MVGATNLRGHMMSWGLIGGIAGAVIGGIVLVWLLIRRRRKRIEAGLPVWYPFKKSYTCEFCKALFYARRRDKQPRCNVCGRYV